MMKPELLAPAGDYTCFQAALKAGADAVYMGGAKYGARAYAGNFEAEEVVRALEEAHFFGRKIYLTVNTLMRQNEIDELPDFIAPFYEAGLDGVIVQDVGALSVLRENFPHLPLHASTQMTITDADGAEALKKLGIVRVVPARELSLDEIRILKEKSGLEIECFIHGAMCYSYSGQCLFSSMLGGRSGNRGRCAQPCRQPYRIQGAGNGKECYPLSLKDMSTAWMLPELIDAGIDSFKIEGRMKKPEYVAGVTDIYRRIIDAHLENPGRTVRISELDQKTLTSLYIRSGVSEGYYKKHNGKEMVTLNQPGYAGCEEETLNRIRSQIMEKEPALPVTLTVQARVGQPLRLEARNEQNHAVMDGMTVQPAEKRPLTREDLERQLSKTGGSGFYPSSINIDMDEAIFLPIKAVNELRRQVLEELRRQRIAGQMPYVPAFSEKEDAKPAAQVTAFAAEVSAGPAVSATASGQSFPDRPADLPAVHVTVHTEEQLQCALQAKVNRIYVPQSSLNASMEALLRQEAATRQTAQEPKPQSPRPELFLSFPVIHRQDAAGVMERIKKLLQSGIFDGVQLESLSGLEWLRTFSDDLSDNLPGQRLKTAFDHRIYIWNRQTWEYWKDAFDTWCAPLELNRKELYALPAEKKEILVYGKIPMMTTANCIRKTSGHCLKESGGVGKDGNSIRKGNGNASPVSLLDRYQASFPVLTDCGSCYNVIYNSVPHSLHDYLGEIVSRQVPAVRLDFLDESGADMERIIKLFQEGFHGRSSVVKYPFTTGHFKKGAQ